MKIVVGVSGGIAIYKILELVRTFKKRGDEVKIVMTHSATQFISPELFREISLEPVMTDIFGNADCAAHIKLATWCDAMVIAPATANIIGKIASGIADDALTTVAIALPADTPLIIALAMNTHMYLNAAVTANITTLKMRGVHIIEPASGDLACGTEGVGRLPEPAQIISQFDSIINEIRTKSGDNRRLNNCKIIVTAGGTREAIDPVRFISNRSSGKMGHAIAKVACERGAEVVLITTSEIEVPAAIKVIKVETAEQMRLAILSEYDNAAAVVMAAAVADYRVEEPATQKIKKTSDDLTLHLVKNPDILLELGEKKRQQVLVGFAAETQAVESNAMAKLNRKKLDMIVANDVSAEGAGFGVDTNIITLITTSGVKRYPIMSKIEVAGIILDRLEQFLCD